MPSSKGAARAGYAYRQLLGESNSWNWRCTPIRRTLGRQRSSSVRGGTAAVVAAVTGKCMSIVRGANLWTERSGRRSRKAGKSGGACGKDGTAGEAVVARGVPPGLRKGKKGGKGSVHAARARGKALSLAVHVGAAEGLAGAAGEYLLDTHPSAEGNARRDRSSMGSVLRPGIGGAQELGASGARVGAPRCAAAAAVGAGVGRWAVVASCRRRRVLHWLPG